MITRQHHAYQLQVVQMITQLLSVIQIDYRKSQLAAQFAMGWLRLVGSLKS